MKEIELSKFGKKNKGKYVTLVDDEDYEYLNSLNWSVTKCKNRFYAIRSIILNGKESTQFMHGAIMNAKGIDHRDMNGLNNQKSNLRLCTKSENGMNTRKQENKSSIYKGVSLFKRTNKWTAYIGINHKKIHIGYFDLEINAAKAYNDKAIELFCEFANLNIIPNEQ